MDAIIAFRNYLDRVHGTVHIAGGQYSASRALERVDPVSFNRQFQEWLDRKDLWEDV